jgi:transcriptional regulator with XRE-family HTH domain
MAFQSLEVAEQIRRLRRTHGLTQARLAELLNVSVVSVNRWEQGHARPSALLQRRLFELEQYVLGSAPHGARPAAAALPPNTGQPSGGALPPSPHNLPQPLTSFIGRTRALGDLQRRIDTTRLLTLLGPGGTGKTRLALEFGHRLAEPSRWNADPAMVGAGVDERLFPDGVWLVELAPLTGPALVPQAVAWILRVPEDPARPLLETLGAWLRPRRLLLILDSCEHLRDACATLAAGLLRASAALHVLATSRAPLGVTGEQL